MGSRARILKVSVQLFNNRGVANTSTNHIAEAANISPGNLYYHFQDKEELIRELFGSMTSEVEGLWAEACLQTPTPTPTELMTDSFDIFWRYRFFHREMYLLRRNDQKLARLWKAHLKTASASLGRLIEQWTFLGYTPGVTTDERRRELVQLVMTLASTSLQVFESEERQASSIVKQNGVAFCVKMLLLAGSASAMPTVRQNKADTHVFHQSPA